MGDFAGGLLLARELIPPGSTVLCAVSGGADSVCLLHQLYRLRREVPFTLAAAHYNHQLRGEEADRDAAFVRQFITLCCGRDRLLQPDGTWRDLPPVELFIGGGDVSGEARRRRRGVEETARDMRYDFLRRTARTCGAQWIATAHNAGDNAETILLHLIRGTGLRGLGGIRPRQGDVIRPLLSVSRDEIEAYLRFWGLPWREDATNRDDAYTRNRLRHRVLPELEAISPGLTVRLGEMSARLRADEAYLVEQAQASLAPLEEIPGGLSLPAESVAALPQPLAVRAARILLGRMEGGNENCSAAHLEGLIALCRSGDPSAELNLPGGVTAHRAYSRLILTRSVPPAAPENQVPLPLPGTAEWTGWTVHSTPELYRGQRQGPLQFWLDRDAVHALTLRGRRTGDRLKLPGRPTKTVKKWCVDQRIPARLRPGLPVLDCGGRLAGVAGLGPEAALLPPPGAPAWRIQLIPPPEFQSLAVPEPSGRQSVQQ